MIFLIRVVFNVLIVSFYCSGMYATVFPRNVDKFIIDSNISPYNTVDDIAKQWATGFSFRYNYLKYTCWAANAKVPDSCPVELDDLVACISTAKVILAIVAASCQVELDGLAHCKSIAEVISTIDVDPTIGVDPNASDTDEFDEISSIVGNTVLVNSALKAKSPVELLLHLLTIDPETMGKVCTADKDSVATLLADIEDLSDSAKKRSVGIDGPDCDTYDQPSDENDPICFDENPGVIVTFLVNGQDQAGGVSAYNDDVFIRQVLEFQEEYGHEYIQPVVIYAKDGLSVNYYWPKNIPLPILGKSLSVG